MKKYSPLPHMPKLLTDLIDLLFPPSREERLLRAVDQPTLRALYRPGIFQNTVYLCHYSEPVVQAAIIENKFHHHRSAALLLGNLLDHWLSTQSKPTLFVAIPLGKQRLRQRGHNQVETILQTVVPKADITTNMLRRRIETLPQSQLKKSSRKQNVREAFEFVGNTEILSNYSCVVLVDDVVTTEATLLAARASLAPHLPPHVTLTCVAIAN
jgi:predicted amidophosphoribosyltransferase